MGVSVEEEPRGVVVLTWEGRGPWHSDYLTVRIHPLLNTALFKLVFFFLTTALIFLITVALAVLVIKLCEVVSWAIQVCQG